MIMKKKRKLLTGIILSLISIFTVVSCNNNVNPPDPGKDDNPSVLVEDDDNINTGDISVIDKENGGKDVEIRINVEDGYDFQGVDYENYDYVQEGSEIIITLHDVEDDVRIRIDIAPVGSSISGGDRYTQNLSQSDGKFQLIDVREGYELLDYSEGATDYFNLGVGEDGFFKMGFIFRKEKICKVKLTFTETKIEPGPVNTKKVLTDEEIYAVMPKETAKEKFVYYSTNGGDIVNNYFEGAGYYKRIDTDHHLRPNSDIGSDIFEREGYYLESWNTKANGTGTRIGLGSRFTSLDRNMILYAQWVKENNPNNFTYVENEYGVTLTGCQNISSYSTLVLPKKIDDKKVTCISAGFLSGKTIDKLYLPLALKMIEKEAFNNCVINEMHFYENINVCDDCFKNTRITKLYINAILAPRYMTLEHTHVADGIDRLLLNINKKHMIFFGGCAFSYGLRSEIMAYEYSDYFITNLGVMGGSNAAFQFDILKNICKRGDIIIHAPEEMSKYQLMYTTEAEIRMFQNLEANYDLLSYSDINDLPHFFDEYGGYVRNKKTEPAQKYSTYCPNYNEYGDILPEVSVSMDGVTRRRDEQGFVNKRYGSGDEKGYHTEYVTQESMNRLASYYDKFKNIGVTCLFTFSPINSNSLTKEEVDNKIWLQFENKVRQYLTSYPIISKAENYLYESIYFFEEDYHLTYEGAALRTQALIQDMNAYFASLS